MVSEWVIAARSRKVLRCSDINTTTINMLCEKMEEEFGLDFSGRKSFIKDQVILFLESDEVGSNENELMKMKKPNQSLENDIESTKVDDSRVVVCAVVVLGGGEDEEEEERRGKEELMAARGVCGAQGLTQPKEVRPTVPGQQAQNQAHHPGSSNHGPPLVVFNLGHGCSPRRDGWAAVSSARHDTSRRRREQGGCRRGSVARMAASLGSSGRLSRRRRNRTCCGFLLQRPQRGATRKERWMLRLLAVRRDERRGWKTWWRPSEQLQMAAAHRDGDPLKRTRRRRWCRVRRVAAVPSSDCSSRKMKAAV
ncbi:hypothetical protein Tsubulata_042626 [Turnera subulata]|uniref:DEK-C domain-containing protein n=1 Tax=Turnera subulata TaxID=218843 RepID=A0A9Q0F2B2_9ROSI|nr:hypothetical protein Tsubulata_042626 [Turnera subulata]